MQIGFLGLLGLLFIGLKLGNVIDWSWWFVTLPLWGSFAFAMLLLGVVVCLQTCKACKATINK
jgi:hypothetical protein